MKHSFRVKYSLKDSLVDGYIQGQPESTEKLRNLISKNCTETGFSYHESEDLAQEILVHIWKERDRSGMMDRPGNYSTGICRNKIADAMFRKGKEIRLGTANTSFSWSRDFRKEHQSEVPVDEAYEPELAKALHTQEMMERVNQLVDDLPEGSLKKGWEALWDYQVNQGLSYREMASLMDTSPGTVKSWINRTKVYFREKLERDGYSSRDL